MMAGRSYKKLLKRLGALAGSPTVSLHQLGTFSIGGRTYPMVMAELGVPGPDKRSVMVAAGIHGDEPAGVEAAVRFLEENAHNEQLISHFNAVVFPCCNPTGYELGTRGNASGVDLNRQFSVPNPSPEVQLIMRGLAGRCFDLLFDMHEDVDGPGLYLYEITRDPSRRVGEKIITAAQAMGCPIDRRKRIEGMKSEGGIIRRKIIRFPKANIPQAIYTFRTCGSHVITLEPPASKLPFEDRVRIELTALDIALQSMPTLKQMSN